MLAFLLALSPVPAAAPAPPTPQDEIVIVAERLKRLRFAAHVGRRGLVHCRVKQSSGGPAYDAIACPAVEDCARRALRTAAEAERCVRERLLTRAAELAAAEQARN
jgi:hypothetical protein